MAAGEKAVAHYKEIYIYIYNLNVFYKINLHTSLHIDSLLMTISSEVSTRKCLTSAWYKTGIFKNSGMWLIYNCSGIQMVCESHKNV